MSDVLDFQFIEVFLSAVVVVECETSDVSVLFEEEYSKVIIGGQEH